MRAFNRELDDAMESGAEHAKQHVERHSRFKRRTAAPGSLKDATETKFVRMKSGRVVKVLSKKRTAPFLEYGTRPHVIRPRRAPALRFMWRGKLVFAQKVNHPGTKGRKFLWRATFAAHRYAGRALETAMSRAAKRF